MYRTRTLPDVVKLACDYYQTMTVPEALKKHSSATYTFIANMQLKS